MCELGYSRMGAPREGLSSVPIQYLLRSEQSPRSASVADYLGYHVNAITMTTKDKYVPRHNVYSKYCHDCGIKEDSGEVEHKNHGNCTEDCGYIVCGSAQKSLSRKVVLSFTADTDTVITFARGSSTDNIQTHELSHLSEGHVQLSCAVSDCSGEENHASSENTHISSLTIHSQKLKNWTNSETPEKKVHGESTVLRCEVDQEVNKCSVTCSEVCYQNTDSRTCTDTKLKDGSKLNRSESRTSAKDTKTFHPLDNLIKTRRVTSKTSKLANLLLCGCSGSSKSKKIFKRKKELRARIIPGVGFLEFNVL